MMHPSSINFNGKTSISTSNQQRTTCFCNYNHHENPSNPCHIHCHPHYFHLEDQTIDRERFQQLQPPFFTDHNYHAAITAAHESSDLKTTTTDIQFSYNNGRVVDNGDLFNSTHVIMNDNCLKGKRSSKKDRHSKINTARGPRDRRMRLSLDVAKKFFKLQDILGFDKASNTIEWLLMKSKPAIGALLPQQLNQSCSLNDGSNSASSASEDEVLSGIDDQSTEKAREDQVVLINKAKFSSCSSNKDKRKYDKVVRKSVCIHHSLAKETREKARARARKRTTEKKNTKLGCVSAANRPMSLDQVVLDQNTNRIGSWIPLGEKQVQATDQAEYAGSNFQFKQGNININVCDNSSVMSSNWSPSLLFNYQNNPGPSHEHQFNEFQILGKPWEGEYN